MLQTLSPTPECRRLLPSLRHPQYLVPGKPLGKNFWRLKGGWAIINLGNVVIVHVAAAIAAPPFLLFLLLRLLNNSNPTRTSQARKSFSATILVVVSSNDGGCKHYASALHVTRL